MDIIDVLSDKLRSKLHQAAFEVSSTLAEPTATDALERLELAVSTYSELVGQIQTLENIREKYSTETGESENEN